MDSEAAFAERARQVNISETHLAKLQAKKLSTYGAFAFLSSFQPGSSDERPFVRALASALDVAEADLNDAVLSSFRRLYYECHTMTLGDLRARIERKDDDAPKRVPMAERSERLAQLRAELSGVTIDVQLEPAHRLLDTVMQQIEDNCISFIPLKDCLSQESELLSHKHETTIDFSHDGTMRLSKRQREIKADISGDLKVKMAMQRRALAYHMAGACSYGVLDGIIARMFSLLTKEPVAGFRAVSLQQLILAEREMWMMAAQETRGQLISATGKPLEQALVKLQDAQEVKYHLLPLPQMTSNPKHDDEPDPKRVKKGKGKHKNDKGKGKGNGLQLPNGCVPSTPSNQRICFQYNRKRCNHQDKNKCPRGPHVCWRQGCHQNHPGEDCNSK